MTKQDHRATQGMTRTRLALTQNDSDRADQARPPGGASGRLLVWVTISFILGIVIARFWLSGSGSGVDYLLAATAFCALVVLVLYRLLDLYRLIMLMIVIFAGFLAYFTLVNDYNERLAGYANESLSFEGVIIDEPLHYDDYSIYRLQLDTIEKNNDREHLKADVFVRIDNSDQGYQFGERLKLQGSLILPRGQRNPGGFDHRFYLSSQGIYATIYPQAHQISSLGPADRQLFSGVAINLRTAMVSNLKKTLPSPAAELLAAILFGMREHLPAAIADNFRQAGVGHLMAVSGLHVGLVAALLIGLMRSFGLKGRVPLLLAIALVLGYVFLTGMRPSALRAGLMVALGFGALLFDREPDFPVAISLAALITLVINPLLLFTVGFQLSYIVTLTIVYAYRPLIAVLTRLKVLTFLRPALAVTLAAQFGALPLTVYYFHHLPLAALLFNLLLLPMIALIIGLGLSGSMISFIFPQLGEIILWAARPLLELMVIITNSSNLPGLYLSVYPPSAGQVLIIYLLLAMALICYYNFSSIVAFVYQSPLYAKLCSSDQKGLTRSVSYKKTLYFVIPLFLIVVVWSTIIFPGSDQLRVVFLDVGQGASALIQSPCGATIMIDAGGDAVYRGDPGAIGERVIIPLFRHEGIKNIDLAVISHPHEDHFGGFISLIEFIPIETMLISPQEADSPYYNGLLEAARESGTMLIESASGQLWQCGPDLKLEVLYPSEVLLQGTSSDLNNNSVVLKLLYQGVIILFTGDIENAAVQKMLSEGLDLKSDILLVPHHGGSLESFPRLLDAVKPSVAVIQVGQNSFGHPHPDLIALLEELAIPIYRNDQHGAIIIDLDSTGYEVKSTTQTPLPIR